MVHYFYGVDTYAARQALTELAGKQQARIRWLDKENLAERSLASWLEQSSGLFGTELVVLRDASELPKAVQETIPEVALAATTTWVIWDRGLPDKRTKLFKSLRKSAREFTYPTPEVATRWLQELAQAQGATLEPAAARLLLERVGGDGWRLTSEVAKLALVTLTITTHDVAEATTATATADIFPTLEAVVRHDQVRALGNIEILLQAGQSELYILSMLGYQFRTLLQIKQAQRTIPDEAGIARHTQLHPYVVQKSLPLAAQFSETQLLDTITKVLATDVAIKQGKVDARTAIIMLVVSLVQKNPA
jgi:DNA polymerase III delta subunit